MTFEDHREGTILKSPPIGGTMDMLASIETQYLEDNSGHIGAVGNGDSLPSSYSNVDCRTFDLLVDSEEAIIVENEENQNEHNPKSQKDSSPSQEMTITNSGSDLSSGADRKNLKTEELLAGALIREGRLKEELALRDRSEQLHRVNMAISHSKKVMELTEELELAKKELRDLSEKVVQTFDSGEPCDESLTTFRQISRMDLKKWILLGTTNILLGSLFGLGCCYGSNMSPNKLSYVLFLASAAAVAMNHQIESIKE